MEKLCFTAAEMPMQIAYFVIMGILLVCWVVLWKRIQIRDSVHGKQAHESFFKWLLFETTAPFLNWFWVTILIYKIIRLICTLIFGCAPDPQ